MSKEGVNMHETLRQLEEASVRPQGAKAEDDWDLARKMIEDSEKLRDMLDAKFDRVLQPALGRAQQELKGYKKIGLPSRFASDLLVLHVVPALRKYADEVQRVASEVETRFK